MVTDAILRPLLSVVDFAFGLLPRAAPMALPGGGALAQQLAGLDSLIPIGGPLRIALGILSAVVVFMLVRLILTVWNLIWP
jgi:hypothetical protein